MAARKCKILTMRATLAAGERHLQLRKPIHITVPVEGQQLGWTCPGSDTAWFAIKSNLAGSAL